MERPPISPAAPHLVAALERSAEAITTLQGQTLDLLTINPPRSIPEAFSRARIMSKLSPLLGNLLEFQLIEYLNGLGGWPEGAEWVRQDPGFPDTVLADAGIPNVIGIEVKTWFPLATEITARFRESQRGLAANAIKIAVIGWLPERLLSGRPQIVRMWIDDALAVAQSRDRHYHAPPTYVVLEPEVTAARTRNLQQTICNGYRFQGTTEQLLEATAAVEAWGPELRAYSPDRTYQERLRALLAAYPYRLDTNFAKIDRIQHESLEEFKARMLALEVQGRTILQWARHLFSRHPIDEDYEAARSLLQASGP